ncbi:MAG: DUF4167 domain-containing protein [Alphaproteobacteria bacterium]
MNKSFNRPRRHNNNARSVRSIALQQITRFTNLDSSGPLGKLRGTPLQLAEKYQNGAKDAQTQGDVVLAQTCLQYADHYLRLQNVAIENEQSKIRGEEPAILETTETPEAPETPTEVAPQSTPNVEKRPIIRRKKAAPESLSMPIEALEQKSETTPETPSK